MERHCSQSKLAYSITAVRLARCRVLDSEELTRHGQGRSLKIATTVAMMHPQKLQHSLKMLGIHYDSGYTRLCAFPTILIQLATRDAVTLCLCLLYIHVLCCRLRTASSGIVHNAYFHLVMISFVNATYSSVRALAII